MTSMIETRSRRRWTLAAIAGLLVAVATTSLYASHGDQPRCYGSGTTCGVSHRSWSCGPRAPARRAQRQYERGYAAGKRHGWSDGYTDGLHGYPFDPAPGVRRRSTPYVVGYKRGYSSAYTRGYRHGRRQRSPFPCFFGLW